jgi:hypothetical protein
MAGWRLPSNPSSGVAVAAAFAATLAAGGIASAQDAVMESVESRPRPEYEPIGFELDNFFAVLGSVVSGQPAQDPERPRGPLSSFYVLPKFALDLEHTDNLFRTPTNARSDYIAVARPSVRILSDWDNHEIGLLAEAGIGRHKQTPSENYDDYKLEMKGMLTVDDLSKIDGTAGAERTHEQRGDIDDPGAAFGPTFIDIYKLNGSYERRVSDGVLLRPYLSWTQLQYEDNGSIDNADRWHDDYEFRLRVGYEFTPGTTAFVQPKYTSIVYRQQFDRNGLQRDTQLLELLAGVTWDASSVTFLEAGVGFLSARFDEPTFSDETQPTAHLELTWNATPLVSVNSSIDRTFSPTTTAGLAGTLNTIYQASVDWEAMYNVILGVDYLYRQEEFIDATPSDTRATNRFAVNGRWLISQYFFADAEFAHENRSGDFPSDSLEENSVIVTLGAQL